jgi:hypothetical protein
VPSQDQYKDLDDLLQQGLSTEHISEELKYAACHWANHLDKMQEIDSDLIGTLEAFAQEHLMHWFEVLAFIGQLDLAHGALKKALSILVCQIT